MANVNDLYNAVAREADTCGLNVHAADTRRVCSLLFRVLAALPPVVGHDLIARAMRAAQRPGKKPPQKGKRRER